MFKCLELFTRETTIKDKGALRLCLVLECCCFIVQTSLSQVCNCTLSIRVVNCVKNKYLYSYIADIVINDKSWCKEF